MRAIDKALLAGICVAGALALMPPHSARADAASDVATGATTSTDGKVIYQQVCQACHMANAKGAVGAGVIPALAGNPKLQNAGYPVYMILNGNGGMMSLGSILNDVQIAAVVNYVRGNFGNHFDGTIKPADVAAMRGPPLHSEN